MHLHNTCNAHTHTHTHTHISMFCALIVQPALQMCIIFLHTASISVVDILGLYACVSPACHFGCVLVINTALHTSSNKEARVIQV